MASSALTVTPTSLGIPPSDAAVRAAAADAARGDRDAGHRGRAVRQHRRRARPWTQFWGLGFGVWGLAAPADAPAEQLHARCRVSAEVLAVLNSAACLHAQQPRITDMLRNHAVCRKCSQTCWLYVQSCAPASQLPIPQRQHASVLPSRDRQPPSSLCTGDGTSGHHQQQCVGHNRLSYDGTQMSLMARA